MVSPNLFIVQYNYYSPHTLIQGRQQLLKFGGMMSPLRLKKIFIDIFIFQKRWWAKRSSAFSKAIIGQKILVNLGILLGGGGEYTGHSSTQNYGGCIPHFPLLLWPFNMLWHANNDAVMDISLIEIIQLNDRQYIIIAVITTASH